MQVVGNNDGVKGLRSKWPWSRLDICKEHTDTQNLSQGFERRFVAIQRRHQSTTAGQQPRMPPLPAGEVEHPCPGQNKMCPTQNPFRWHLRALLHQSPRREKTRVKRKDEDWRTRSAAQD